MRIYVAGPYSADNIVKALDHMRNGMRMATRIMLEGHSPFVPWFDYHFQLMLREGEHLSVEDYYRYSIDWLKVSDAMLVLPGWKKSEGTIKEIEIAKEMNIPIFYRYDFLIDSLKKWGFDSRLEKKHE